MSGTDRIRAAGRQLGCFATGLRSPVVAILLLIALFTAISGKPLDGAAMAAAGIGLAWDTGRRRPLRDGRKDPVSAVPAAGWGGPARGALPGGAPAGVGAAPGLASGPALAGLAEGGPAVAAGRSTGAAQTRRRAAAVLVAAGGVIYAVVTGAFLRYSWPATAAVVAMGAVVVMIGWRGPRRSRPTPPLPRRGAAAWGVVFVVGCLWELSALLQQPTLTTSSYAHPTLSTLTDPLLASSPGRALVLAAWLALGWFLVDR